ncbi:MAG: YHYH protein [Planctomycetota bacterium]
MKRIAFLCWSLMISCIGIATEVVAHEGHDHDHATILASAKVGNPAGTFDSKVEISERNGYRYINSNGLPEHETGQFPGAGNPNRIREQRHQFRVPLQPTVASKPTSLKLGKFGVALNGVPFDPGAAEFWRRDFSSPWQYAVIGGKVNLGLDMNNAHVQPTGDYHYHGRSPDLIARLAKEARAAGKSMTLIGYAADGYPVYDCEVVGADGNVESLRSGYRLKSGQRPAGSSGPGGAYDGTFVGDYEHVEGVGDLDAFNGRSGVTPEYPSGTFYYVLTKEFPYIPRMLKGTPDDSFVQRGPGGPGRGGPGGPGGPRGPRGRGGRPPFGPPLGRQR